jgi:hypothetical protein
MNWRSGTVVIRSLTVSVAVLLAAGGLAATTVVVAEPATDGADARAGATGLGAAGLLLDEPVPTVPGPPAVVPPPTAVSPTTVAPAPPTSKALASPTTRPPAARTPGPTTTTTTSRAPEFFKSMPNPPGHLPAASSWRAEAPGVSVRMRIEPPNPVAGQPVRIHIDYTGAYACCIIELFFGDDTVKFIANNDPPCRAGGTLSPGAHSTVLTHTWAAPGTYRAFLTALDADLCTLPPVPGPDTRVEDLVHHIELFACIAVGPGTPAVPGCDPLPPFGPYFPR